MAETLTHSASRNRIERAWLGRAGAVSTGEGAGAGGGGGGGRAYAAGSLGMASSSAGRGSAATGDGDGDGPVARAFGSVSGDATASSSCGSVFVRVLTTSDGVVPAGAGAVGFTPDQSSCGIKTMAAITPKTAPTSNVTAGVQRPAANSRKRSGVAMRRPRHSAALARAL